MPSYNSQQFPPKVRCPVSNACTQSHPQGRPRLETPSSRNDSDEVVTTISCSRWVYCYVSIPQFAPRWVRECEVGSLPYLSFVVDVYFPLRIQIIFRALKILYVCVFEAYVREATWEGVSLSSANTNGAISKSGRRWWYLILSSLERTCWRRRFFNKNSASFSKRQAVL